MELAPVVRLRLDQFELCQGAHGVIGRACSEIGKLLRQQLAALIFIGFEQALDGDVHR